MWGRWKRKREALRFLQEDLEQHIDDEIEENVARGMSPDEARTAAMKRFGSLTRTREDTRAVWSVLWLEQAVQDLRYAVRTLLKNPAFLTVAVATLALGIGANTTVFSVVYGILFRPLPYEHPDQIVRIIQSRQSPPPEGPPGSEPASASAITTGQLLEWRARTKSFSTMAGFQSFDSELRERDLQIPVRGAAVSSAMFPLLNAQPLLGRAFDFGDEEPGFDDTVILSHRAWQAYFGGDPEVLGRSIMLGEDAYTVVGVMAPGFAFPDRTTGFWTPLALRTFDFNLIPFNGRVLVSSDGGSRRVEALGRLAEGVSLEAAVAEANVLFPSLLDEEDRVRAEAYGAAGLEAPPASAGTVELVRLRDEVVAPVRSALMALFIAVNVVLCIACMNVANLLLARATGRRTEFAIRGALGAGRGRLIRQVLTESVLLASLGGVVGTLLAFGSVRMAASVGAGHIPRIEEIGVDPPVLLFALAASLLTGVVFGLVPALRMPSLHPATVRTARPSSTGAHYRTLSVLGTAEIGLAVVLLAGSGLLIHSFLNLANFDWGYDHQNILTFAVPPSISRPVGYYEDLLERIGGLPVVEAVAITSSVPILSPRGLGDLGPVVLEGRTDATLEGQSPPFEARVVSHDYFIAMGMRIVEGRGFEEEDRGNQPHVLVVNRSLAGVLGSAGLVGRVLRFPPKDGREVRARIVGIVDDVRYAGLEREPGPELYLDIRQAGDFIPDPPPPPPPPPGAVRPVPLRTGQGNLVATHFAVRTSSASTSALADVRNVLQAADSDMTVTGMTTIEDALERYLASPRFYALLAGALSLIALTIAAVGVYGVVSYSVSQRTHEIGIRTAIGGTRRDAMWAVVRTGTVSVSIGVGCGLLGAVVLTRYIDSLLFGLTPTDPGTFASVVVVVTAVAGIALYLPARRAARVDPAVALRHE